MTRRELGSNYLCKSLQRCVVALWYVFTSFDIKQIQIHGSVYEQKF